MSARFDACVQFARIISVKPSEMTQNAKRGEGCEKFRYLFGENIAKPGKPPCTSNWERKPWTGLQIGPLMNNGTIAAGEY